MAVIKQPHRAWPGAIPYLVGQGPHEWLEFTRAQIDAFNAAIRKRLFVPRQNEAAYVEIVPLAAGGSFIGRQGGRQELSYTRYDAASLLHELAHCVGLGHEQFHTRFPGAPLLLKDPQVLRNEGAAFQLQISAQSFQANYRDYVDSGPFDSSSIMLYPLDALGITPEQYRQCGGTPYVKQLVLSRGDIFALRNLAAHVPDGVAQLAGAGTGAGDRAAWPSKFWPTSR